MPEKWTGRLVGRMHNECVTYEELGEEMGISKAYICQILNSKRKPDGIKKRMEDAFEAILAKRNK